LQLANTGAFIDVFNLAFDAMSRPGRGPPFRSDHALFTP